MNIYKAGQKSTIVIEAPGDCEESFAAFPEDSNYDGMEVEDDAIPPPSTCPVVNEVGNYLGVDDGPLWELKPHIPTIVLDCANIGWAYGMVIINDYFITTV